VKPLGIVELVRTGVVAMGRGVRILDSDYEPRVPATVSQADRSVQYQVYGV
jgi:hypothetical protein